MLVSLAAVSVAGVILKRIHIRRLSHLCCPLGSLIVLEAETQEQLQSLHKWEQGDKALYSSASIEARYKNRTNKEVYHWLDVWWDSAFERSGSHSGSRSERPTVMSKQVYVNIYVRVSQAIFEFESEDWEEAELVRLVEEAWDEESGGQGHLTRSQFNDSLFELVDMWTDTVEPAEYVSFLRRLHESCFDSATFEKKMPSQEERMRRSGEHKQRRAAVSIQKSTRKRQKTMAFKVKKEAATRIQARARGVAVREQRVSKLVKPYVKPPASERAKERKRSEGVWRTSDGDQSLNSQLEALDWGAREDAVDTRLREQGVWRTSDGDHALNSQLEALDWGDREDHAVDTPRASTVGRWVSSDRAPGSGRVGAGAQVDGRSEAGYEAGEQAGAQAAARTAALYSGPSPPLRPRQANIPPRRRLPMPTREKDDDVQLSGTMLPIMLLPTVALLNVALRMPTTNAGKASAQASIKASTYSTAGSGWHVRSARALETRSPRTSIRTHGHGVGQPGGWNGSLSPRFIESDRTIDHGTLDGTSPTRRRLVSVAPSGGRQPRSRAERLGDVEQSPFPTLPPLPPPTAAAQLRRRQHDASPPHDLNVDLWVDSARRRDARTRIETAKAITRARGGSARTPPRTAPRGLEPSKPPSSRHPTQNHPTQLVPPETVPITTTQCDESIPGGA
jgi:hypothetical protein